MATYTQTPHGEVCAKNTYSGVNRYEVSIAAKDTTARIGWSNFYIGYLVREKGEIHAFADGKLIAKTKTIKAANIAMADYFAQTTAPAPEPAEPQIELVEIEDGVFEVIATPNPDEVEVEAEDLEAAERVAAEDAELAQKLAAITEADLDGWQFAKHVIGRGDGSCEIRTPDGVQIIPAEIRPLLEEAELAAAYEKWAAENCEDIPAAAYQNELLYPKKYRLSAYLDGFKLTRQYIRHNAKKAQSTPFYWAKCLMASYKIGDCVLMQSLDYKSPRLLFLVGASDTTAADGTRVLRLEFSQMPPLDELAADHYGAIQKAYYF